MRCCEGTDGGKPDKRDAGREWEGRMGEDSGIFQTCVSSGSFPIELRKANLRIVKDKGY